MDGRAIAELTQLRREVETLRTSLRESSSETQQLRAALQQSSQAVELLQAERDQFLEQLHQKNREIDGLQHQLQQLLRRLFGRSAEKIDPKQMQLFEKLLNELAPPTPAPEVLPEPMPVAQPTTKRHGRRRLPADLPRAQRTKRAGRGVRRSRCAHDKLLLTWSRFQTESTGH